MIKKRVIFVFFIFYCQADNDFTREQLIAVRARLENVKEQNGNLTLRIPEFRSQETQVSMVTLGELEALNELEAAVDGSDDDEGLKSEDDKNVTDSSSEDEVNLFIFFIYYYFFINTLCSLSFILN